MTDVERLQTKLDEQWPRWWYEWATADELLSHVRECERFGEDRAKLITRTRIARRLVLVINAALDADLVELKS
jgi:hypothetical protein